MAERAAELKAQANAAVAKSDFTGAVKHLTEALELQPSAKELWSNRAFAWSALGRHDEALKDAQQCIRVAPGFSKGHLRAGRALIALGRHDDAADLLEDAFEKMPQDYALKEALEDAISAASSGAGPAVVSAAPNGPAAGAPPSASSGGDGGGLNSSYYYAAVPASQRKLPVAAPPRIDPVGMEAGGVANGVANGHVRDDIERKGMPLVARARAATWSSLTRPSCLLPRQRPGRFGQLLLRARPKDRLYGADGPEKAQRRRQHDRLGRQVSGRKVLQGKSVPTHCVPSSA
jgi:hypothetical protein